MTYLYPAAGQARRPVPPLAQVFDEPSPQPGRIETSALIDFGRPSGSGEFVDTECPLLIISRQQERVQEAAPPVMERHHVAALIIRYNLVGLLGGVPAQLL